MFGILKLRYTNIGNISIGIEYQLPNLVKSIPRIQKECAEMTSREDKVRSDIITKFGSIPKMAREIGLPQNTIYHALERGLDNTTRKTSNTILHALYGSSEYAVVNLWSDSERELIELYRALPEKGKRALLAGLREYGNQ